MIKHYLKVAFRNLAKYKVQSIVSILGLAVGFVCFALSTLWIRYEMLFTKVRNVFIWCVHIMHMNLVRYPILLLIL